jgi:hypothetical protein
LVNAADPVLLKAAQFALVNATLNSNDFTTLLSFDANYLYRSLGVATSQVQFAMHSPITINLDCSCLIDLNSLAAQHHEFILPSSFSHLDLIIVPKSVCKWSEESHF